MTFETPWDMETLFDRYQVHRDAHRANEGSIAAAALAAESAMHLRRFDESRAALAHHAALSGSRSLADYHLALMDFFEGNWHQGWKRFEARFDVLPQPDPIALQRWSGESLQGKKILLVPEQGRGDVLQMLRYLPVLREQCARLTCVPFREYTELLPLALSSHEVVSPDQLVLSDYDFQLGMLSLPLALERCTPTDGKGLVPWLRPDAVRCAKWRRRLQSVKGFRVAVVWSGNPDAVNDVNRSIDPGLLTRLATIPGVSLIAMQFREGRYSLPGIHRHMFADDVSHEIGPWEEAAAALSACDLLLTVDTAMGHLAGSMGLPVWLMLSWNVDPRWTLLGERSDWYPNHTLFRCEEPGQWDAVLEKVEKELRITSNATDGISVKTPQASESKSLRTSGPLLITKGEYGTFLANEQDRFVGYSLCHEGAWLPEALKRMMEFIGPGSTVLECGAYTGNWTVPLALRLGPRGRLYAVEPVRLFRQQMVGNLAMNRILNVEVLGVALGAEKGIGSVPQFHDDRQFNYAGIALNRTGSGEQVPIIPIDEIPGLQPPDLMIIDCNGMEAEVLQGARKLLGSLSPVMYISANNPESAIACQQYLTIRGYTIDSHEVSMTSASSKNHPLFGKIAQYLVARKP